MRSRPVLAGLAAVLSLLAACERRPAGTAQGAEASSGQLNIYTARHYDADQQLYAGFKEATGIEVRTIDGNPAQLVERMKAEGPASPADVVLMADAGALWRAEDAGLLQPTQSAVLSERIPANLRDPAGRWFGFARRARVLVFSKAVAPPDGQAAYADLADPRFRGRVCVRSSDNVYNLSTLAALTEQWGRDRASAWARGVVANMARPPQGGDIDQIRAVAAGQCDVALANSYYWIRLARSQNPADKAAADRTVMVFPEQAAGAPGALVNISGGGVAANAPNRANAVRFLEYLTSPEAQAILAEANNEYPAVQGAETPQAVRPYADFRPAALPVAVYGRRQAEAQALFDEAGWR
ncbi:MAG: extracellular solute-binding protein [Proteobacteria bacterium]|nr:extracellular solute-binding protein [Pseudomonadota bacterium]